MTCLSLHHNRLTGKHFFAHIVRLVYECTTNLKRPCCCTGNIPTELGRCTAMKELTLRTNQLTGTYFFAHIARLVYESTIVLCPKKCVGANPHRACDVCTHAVETHCASRFAAPGLVGQAQPRSRRSCRRTYPAAVCSCDRAPTGAARWCETERGTPGKEL